MRTTLLLGTIIALLAIAAGDVFAQGYYHRTAGRNPVTGRQQIVDFHHPRWTGTGQGGFMFDGGSGSMQITAVQRNRFTGRLEYYNQYMNPWTGARYTTGTQFNPFTGRYQTLHNFVPPPPRKDPREAEVATEDVPKWPRGLRVIETNPETGEVPAEVSPAVEAVEPVESVEPEAVEPPAEIAPPNETAEPAAQLEATPAEPPMIIRFRDR